VNTTSPRSAGGTPAVNNPAADQAEVGIADFRSQIADLKNSTSSNVQPAIVIQQSATSALPLVQAALVAAGPAPGLTPLPSVPSGVSTVPLAAGPVLTVQGALPPINRLGNGGGGEVVVLPDNGGVLPEEPPGSPRKEEQEPKGSPDSFFLLPPSFFREGPEEQPLSFADDYWMTLAAQNPVPPPVLAKNAGPTLAPAAMAVLAFALGMDRRTSPRNGRLLRW